MTTKKNIVFLEESGPKGKSSHNLTQLDFKTVNMIDTELEQARFKFKNDLNSLHEGYAVLKEEVDELWDITKLKDYERDWLDVRSECVQVAAMAIRIIQELCNKKI